MLLSLDVFRSTRLGLVIFLGLAVQLPTYCRGALTWETRRVELRAQPDDTNTTAVFRFKNAGNAAVTISTVKPSCGCTTAELAKLTYAPGESGEIKSVFTFGGAVGEVEKTIQVTTNDAPSNPATLTLHVSIPELFVYSTRLLLWKLAEEPVEQSVTINCLKKIAGIELDPDVSAAATTRIAPLEAGKKYQVFIRPTSSAQAITTSVSLIARFADQTTRTLVIYVMVR